MQISNSGGTGPFAVAKAAEGGSRAGGFGSHLQDAQNVGQQTGPLPQPNRNAGSGLLATAVEQRLMAMRFDHNGEDVGYDQLPPDTQRFFREAEEQLAELEAYRARVADDPDLGRLAKLRPYDPATDEVVMKRLAAMEPRTAQMSGEEYYNYIDSDREKYDKLIWMAESPHYPSSGGVFSADLEQESKVQMVRDFWARGEELPKTFAALEQAWLSDLTRQKAFGRER